MKLKQTLFAALLAIVAALPMTQSQASWWWPGDWFDDWYDGPGWNRYGYGYPYGWGGYPYGGYPGGWGGYPYAGYPGGWGGYPYGGYNGWY